MGKFNKIFTIGRLTKTAEMRSTQKGIAIVSFSVAVSESSKNEQGEWVNYANFFDVTMFGNYAKSCFESLTKGREVAIQGRLKQERWEKDGKKYARVYIICEELEVLRSPKEKTEDLSNNEYKPTDQMDNFQEDVVF